MTPLKNKGINANRVHGHIHLYLIIKNTLLTSTRTWSIKLLRSALRAHNVYG